MHTSPTQYLDTDVLVCGGGSAAMTAAIAAALCTQTNTKPHTLNTDHLRARLTADGVML